MKKILRQGITARRKLNKKVRDNDVAMGQGARPTERPDENSAQAASAAHHSTHEPVVAV